MQIEIVADAREPRVEREFHYGVVGYWKAFRAAGRIVQRRLRGDTQMGMQAQPRNLDAAALQQRTAKRQRQADRISFDVVAERQKSRSVEREIQQPIRTLLENRLSRTIDARENERRRLQLG